VSPSIWHSTNLTYVEQAGNLIFLLKTLLLELLEEQQLLKKKIHFQGLTSKLASFNQK
jgi:hypothetical protein